MDLGLKDRVAAVAAASSGLGLATAVELAREGARVAICSRDPDRLARAVRDLREARRSSGGVLGVAADLSTPEGPETFLGATTRELGRVDILVVNNGGPPAGPPLSVAESDWQAGFELTFLSAVRLVSLVVDGMRESGWGRIVFITSVSVKQPIEDLALSTALRSAVVGYSKVISDDLARHGITVNCVAPGTTLTGRLESLLARRAEARGVARDELRKELEAHVPAGRFGRPEEFAAAVTFLASERASYITGTVLQVDGGLVRSLT